MQLTLITFDNLAPAFSGSPIANGYGGLNWNNFYTVNTTPFPGTGYANGTVSQPNVAFNQFGISASFSRPTPFIFDSVDLTAAWNNGLNIDIQGLLNNVLVDNANFTVNTTGPTLATLNWQNVDEVEFSASGGTNAGLNGYGTYFVLDNLTICVPEPATMTILGVGVAALAGYRWRQRKRPN